MKKSLYNNVIAIGLFILYVFSLVPISFFHVHSYTQPSFASASTCEKQLYFVSYKHTCEHAHLSKTIKKCSICSHHDVLPHIKTYFQFTYQKVFYELTSNQFFISYLAFEHITTSNKGPPVQAYTRA
ncbi:MAG: hypothetical protein R2831_05635 [Chitinophagaceae bacterium]